MTDADVARIEGKLDRILDALGLTEKRRLAPCEIDDMVQKTILQFERKREKKLSHDRQKS